jgi:hypothetical protein
MARRSDSVTREVERTRRRYKPADVRVLFIGESPPAGGTFFYYANSNLYDATREAFEMAVPALRNEPDFLSAFKRLGCYIEDLCEEPVNHLELRDPKRLQARLDGVTPLARRLRRLSPRVVAIVMKAIAGDVAAALAASGHDHVERAELPFPARHYRRYRDQMTELVRSWRTRHLLLSL